MAGGTIQSSGGRYKPQVGSQMASPNVIPMADIMLVLLIIFMVVTPMLQKNKPVDLAQTNTARDMQDADKEDAVVVAGSRAVTSGQGRDWGLSLYTPVIVKYRDEKTDRGIELEEWLR